MNVRQLQILVTVAELGTISKAAERLHVAQPALSRHIRLIEEELGVDLFVRYPKGMVVTPAGEVMVKGASMILRQLEDLQAEVKSFAGEFAGSIAFAAPQAAAEQISSRVISQFTQRFPKVSLRIAVNSSGYVSEWLQSGEVDLGILYELPEIRNLLWRILLDEQLYLVGSRVNGLSMECPVPLRALADRTFILPASKHALRRVVEDSASAIGISLKVSLEIDSTQVTKIFVEQGLGFTILPMASVHRELQAGSLTASPIVDPALSCRLVLAMSSRRLPSVLVAHFAETVSSVIEEMLTQGLWVGYRPEDRHA